MEAYTTSLTNKEKFALCYIQAISLVAEYRAETPEGCDPQGAYIAAAMLAVGALSAYSSSKSAKDSAGADSDAMNRIMALARKQKPGKASLGAIGDFAEGFSLPMVDPMALYDDGEKIARKATQFMRGEGLNNFYAALGEENRGGFEDFLSGSLERANFDFSSIPSEILETLDGSALARASGGPIGFAEELSVRSKIQLQQQGEQGFMNATRLRGGFIPAPVNPADTTFELARIEQANNQLRLGEAQFQMQGLQAMYSGEMDRFKLEAGIFGQPDPSAGVGSAAAASALNTLGQGLTTYWMMSNYGKTQATTPTQAATTTATAT